MTEDLKNIYSPPISSTEISLDVDVHSYGRYGCQTYLALILLVSLSLIGLELVNLYNGTLKYQMTVYIVIWQFLVFLIFTLPAPYIGRRLGFISTSKPLKFIKHFAGFLLLETFLVSILFILLEITRFTLVESSQMTFDYFWKFSTQFPFVLLILFLLLNCLTCILIKLRIYLLKREISEA